MSDELFNGVETPPDGVEISPYGVDTHLHAVPRKLLKGGHDPRVVGAATQFKKGWKGGSGRPPSPLRDATLRYLKNPRKAYAVVDAQWKAATDPEKCSTSAAEWLRDTGEGRPAQLSTEEISGTQIKLILDIP